MNYYLECSPITQTTIESTYYYKSLGITKGIADNQITEIYFDKHEGPPTHSIAFKSPIADTATSWFKENYGCSDDFLNTHITIEHGSELFQLLGQLTGFIDCTDYGFFLFKDVYRFEVQTNYDYSIYLVNQEMFNKQVSVQGFPEALPLWLCYEIFHVNSNDELFLRQVNSILVDYLHSQSVLKIPAK